MRMLMLITLCSLAFPLIAGAVTMDEFLREDVRFPVVYGTNDPSVQVIIPFLPADSRSGEKRPALVLIHGGGWTGGDPSVFYPAARYFASRGIPSFSIGYRLVGPGTKDPSVSDCLADCRAALRYLRSHAAEYGIDPGRIAVLGDSAGGHLAACLGTIPDPADATLGISRADLMIPCNPIVEMGPGVGNTNSWFRLIQKGAAMSKPPIPSAIVPTPEQIALAGSLSPLSFVSTSSAPALVMHGLDDSIVSPDQSKVFVEALKRAGIPAELVLIPGARHAFILPKYTASEKQVIDAMITIDRFLAKKGYVSGDPTLILSPVPAWTPKPRPSPKASPASTSSPTH